MAIGTSLLLGILGELEKGELKCNGDDGDDGDVVLRCGYVVMMMIMMMMMMRMMMLSRQSRAHLAHLIFQKVPRSPHFVVFSEIELRLQSHAQKNPPPLPRVPRA